MNWWRRVLTGVQRTDRDQTHATEGEPPPKYLLHPYTVNVPKADYLAAWHEVRQLPAGVRIIAKLHERLAGVLAEKCPLSIHTSEERSIWLANHDGRLQILELLAEEAHLNVKLSGAPLTEQRLKGPSA